MNPCGGTFDRIRGQPQVLTPEQELCTELVMLTTYLQDRVEPGWRARMDGQGGVLSERVLPWERYPSGAGVDKASEVSSGLPAAGRDPELADLDDDEDDDCVWCGGPRHPTLAAHQACRLRRFEEARRRVAEAAR